MRSSIFSFEHFRHYASLPRSEKLWHVSLACALSGIALLSLRIPECVYGFYGCPQETISTAAVRALSQQTEVLFLGSSHIQWGIRPERYSLRVMNLAGPGMDYSCMERLAQTHLERVPNLKVAVVEFDELPLVGNTLAALENDLRPLLERGLTPCNLPTNNVLVKLKAALYPVLTLPRVTPIHWKSSRAVINPAQHPPKGFAAGYFYTESVMPPGYDPQPRFDSRLRKARDHAMTRQNLQALHRTIDLLRARRIPVVLLRIPHHSLSRNNRPALLRGRVNLLRRSIARWYGTAQEVLIWDLDDAPGFEAHDFFDAEHLNVFGANKLARLLDPRLRALCGRTSR